ncbi:hypothetical protein [Chryseobacterium foetidum]|uniref:hypothetical protein n=1 Tax=Chryseobacterium foetidum TaxID=2951057 RepID=UPI0021C880C6|nr:hypothetical protein [Chryseobacterium foetidum]
MDFNIDFCGKFKTDSNFYMSRLHIDSITKSFGNKEILRDIYLSLETGKTAGLLGRNG